MANILNADNGVVSGSAGIKLSSDTSGVLNIQTNGTTAISVSSSQVVSFPATTTLDFSGTVTLSGGTANGVLYLNGSKVVTSGSTLTFDGTTFANGVAWTTNPMASTQPQYFQYAAGTNFFQLAGDAGVGIRAVRFSNDASNPLIFLGKGRGTYASPAAVQTGDVAGNVRYDVYGGTNQRNIANISGGVETYTSDSNISGYLAFGTSPSGAANSSEKMRLTAAGNLGIGTVSWPSSQRLRVAGGDVGFEGQYLYLTNADANIQMGAAQNAQIINSDSGNLLTISRTGASSAMAFSTAGSERMRLDSAGRFLLGASSNTSRGGSSTTALFYKASGTQYLDIQTGTSGDSGLLFSATSSSAYGLINYSNSVNAMLFYANSAEVFRITSSGLLGLGTTSPAAKLHVVNSTPNSGRQTLFLDSNYGNAGDSAASIRATLNNNAGGTYIWGLTSESVLAHNMEFISGSNWVARSTTASYLSQAGGEFVFYSNQSLTAGNTFTPTERMRLNTSGNLGIGTSSPGCRLQVTQAASAALGAQIALHNNASSAVGNAVEIALLTDGGASPSGTRNARIRAVNENVGNGAANMQFWTWNGSTDAERMRLNSTGLGISEGNNPTQVLSLYRSGSTNAIMSAGNSNTGLDGTWFGVDTAGNGIVNVRGAFPLLFSTSANERARITSGGLVGINTSSPSNAQLVVKGASAYTANTYFAARLQAGAYADTGGYTTMLGFGVEAAAWSKAAIGFTRTGSYDTGYLGFYVNNDAASGSMVGLSDERARIDSSGNLLVGTTSSYTSYGLIQIRGDNKGLAIQDSTDNSYRAIYNQSGTLYFYNGTNEGYLSTAGAWVDASDVRLKENIVPIKHGLDSVMKSQPRSYKMKDGNAEYVGFIAQEMLDVIPECVSGKPEKQLGISYGSLVAVAFKAIQEQQAMIMALKAELDQLKGVH